MVKRHLLTITLLGCCFLAYAAKIETSKLKQQAEIKIAAYNHQLKTTLQAHIELGGLKRGVNGCDAVARNMNIQGSNLGWTLERTSLNIRNPENAPTPWEQSQLQIFANEFAAGKNISQLKVERMSSFGPNKVLYRYMRAIEAEAICMNCHGNNLTDDVKGHLAKDYPNDQSIGFEVGDLMGAFTLEKVVEVD